MSIWGLGRGTGRSNSKQNMIGRMQGEGGIGQLTYSWLLESNVNIVTDGWTGRRVGDWLDFMDGWIDGWMTFDG